METIFAAFMFSPPFVNVEELTTFGALSTQMKSAIVHQTGSVALLSWISLFLTDLAVGSPHVLPVAEPAGWRLAMRRDSEIGDAEVAAILGVGFALPAPAAVSSNVNYYRQFN